MSNSSTHPPPQIGKSSDEDSILTDELRSNLSEIWRFFHRPQDLDPSDTWPFSNIRVLAPHLIPPHNKDAGPIPACLVAALEFDFRYYDQIIERCDHVAFFISDKAVQKMDRFWLITLHHILVAYTRCEHPRTRNASPATCVIANMEGYDCIEEGSGSAKPATIVDIASDRKAGHRGSADDESRSQRQDHRMDLSTFIKVITSIFEKSDRITGDEDEPFIYRLQPILHQMDAAKFPDEHKVPSLFSVLTGRAKEAAQRIRSNFSTIDEFVEGLAKTFVKEHNVQQRKINRWNSIQYSEFRSKVSTEHEATAKCIDYLIAHRKDLPDHMNNEPSLLERIRSIFKHLPWCMTLYERTIPNQDPYTFGQLLKTAASNFDERSKNKKVEPISSSRMPPDLLKTSFRNLLLRSSPRLGLPRILDDLLGTSVVDIATATGTDMADSGKALAFVLHGGLEHLLPYSRGAALDAERKATSCVTVRRSVSSVTACRTSSGSSSSYAHGSHGR